MNSKLFGIGLLYLVVYTIYVDAEENKKCVPGKSYNDSCNTCVCAENKQDERGAWEPIMFCTEMMCFEPDGTEYKPTPAPKDFWQDNVVNNA